MEFEKSSKTNSLSQRWIKIKSKILEFKLQTLATQRLPINWAFLKFPKPDVN